MVTRRTRPPNVVVFETTRHTTSEGRQKKAVRGMQTENGSQRMAATAAFQNQNGWQLGVGLPILVLASGPFSLLYWSKSLQVGRLRRASGGEWLLDGLDNTLRTSPANRKGVSAWGFLARRLLLIGPACQFPLLLVGFGISSMGCQALN